MARLIFKTALTAALLLLLVLMGMNNRQEVEFNLPPIVNKTQKQPAAIMYFAFFAVGLLTGAILVALGPSAMFSLSFNGVAEDEALTLAKRFDWKTIQAAIPK